MAQVTLGTVRFVSPPGYEVVRTGTTTEDIDAGELCTLGSSGWSLAAAGSSGDDIAGIALQDFYSGQGGADFLVHGELDGFSGLTPGALLYPSESVAGGIQDTPAIGEGGQSQVNVVTVDATSGNFTITVEGQTTASIAENAAASAVQTALVALSNVVAGDVVVTGSAGGPFTLTWGGNFAGQTVEVTVADVDLSGGGDSVTITTSQAANPGRGGARMRALTATRISVNFI